MPKKVIITGVTGQAGSTFVEYLLENTDLEIYGMTRRLSVKNHKNLEGIKDPRFKLVSGDLNDGPSLQNLIEEIKPDFFIGAAAQSFVAESWVSPVNTFETDAVSIIYILEAIKKNVPHCRFVNFQTSEQFGDVLYSPQDLNHPMRARSPYGAAKIASHQLIKVYRESYGLFAIGPICFNFESPKRGFEFISQKVVTQAVKLKKQLDNHEDFESLKIGSLYSLRDWGHCKDTVRGMWLALNYDTPEDFIFASNRSNSVKELIDLAFKYVGLDGYWRGEGLNEKYWLADYIKDSDFARRGHPLVVIDPKFFRPADVNALQGDYSKAEKLLGWKPTYSFEDLIKEMVDALTKNNAN